MRAAVQFMSDAKTEAEAGQVATALRAQEGFLGLRVLPPVNQVGKNAWRVQAMFDPAVVGTDGLPDGCRAVVVPDALWREFT